MSNIASRADPRKEAIASRTDARVAGVARGGRRVSASGSIKAAYIAAAVLATAADAVVGKTGLLVGMGLFLALLGVILERTRWLRSEKPE